METSGKEQVYFRFNILFVKQIINNKYKCMHAMYFCLNCARLFGAIVFDRYRKTGRSFRIGHTHTYYRM